MGSAGIYQTSTVCLALFIMVGEYQVTVVVFAQEIVLSRNLAVLFSLLGKLQQKGPFIKSSLSLLVSTELSHCRSKNDLSSLKFKKHFKS